MFNPAMKPPGGGHVPGQAQGQNHGHAMQMAHAAASKVRLAKALGGAQGMSATPPMGHAPQQTMGQDYRQHIQAAIPNTNPAEIHQAVGTLVQQGQFSPIQGQALVQHQGPLVVPKGLHAAAKITKAVMANRLRKPAAMPQMPGGPQRPQAPMAPQAPQRPMPPQAPMAPQRPGMGMPQPQMAGPPRLPMGGPPGAGMPQG